MRSTSASSHANRELAVNPSCSGVNFCCVPSARPVTRMYVRNPITVCVRGCVCVCVCVCVLCVCVCV